MNRNCRTCASVVETLEGRELFSAVPLGISEAAINGGMQLRITASAANNQIVVMQTAAGLFIGNTGGWTKTLTDPITSLWIKGGSGTNSIRIDASVKIDATVFGGAGKNLLQAGSGNDTLVSLGSTADTLIGGSGQDSFWIDNNPAEKIQKLTAAESSSGAVHRVGGFYNIGPSAGAGKKASQAIARALSSASGLKEPAVDVGISYASFSVDPVFASTGPSANDVFQGQIGDCYFLAVLSSTAKVNPTRIRQSILNLGDGTDIVQLYKNGQPVYVHEDNQLPVNADGTLAYADLGGQSSTWVALMEKAWCYVREKPVSYASIDSGWMDEAYSAIGGKPTSTSSADSASAMMSIIQKDLMAGMSVTYATNTVPAGSALIEGHAYSVDSIGLDSKGNRATLTLRNPWGMDANNNGNGYVIVTASEAFNAFSGIVAASV